MEKDATRLDHLRRLLKVLIFIEQNLNEELDLEQLAKVGSFSMYHFHRIFHGAIGETPGAYVRRLRLEQAAGQLAYTDVRITDVALDANYDTPSAFTKAFKKVMGCSPAQYRQSPPLTHKKKDGLRMKPTMNHFEDVSVLSVRKTGDYFNSAPAAWKALREFVHKRGLEGQDMRFIGAYHDNPDITAEGNLRSEACCTAPADVEPEGEVMRKVIEGGKYATFEHQGPLNTLGTTYDKIFADWYPGSGETLSSKPCLVELSELPNSGDRIYSEVKIHIPLE